MRAMRESRCRRRAGGGGVGRRWLASPTPSSTRPSPRWASSRRWRSARQGERGTVAFRLPTYWCSPNFAFLMAEGIAREVARLPWVTRGSVRLEDHMYADEVNAAVERAAGASPTPSPSAATASDLAEVARDVRGQGLPAPPGERCSSACARWDADRGDRGDDAAPARRRRLRRSGGGDPGPRYRALLVPRGLARRPGDLAFRGPEGEALTADGFADYLGHAARRCGSTWSSTARSAGGFKAPLQGGRPAPTASRRSSTSFSAGCRSSTRRADRRFANNDRKKAPATGAREDLCPKS